ncbi:MAG: Gfo/Idh/MocA family oxidoreductase, partial [Phaeodactylibacter sp.]|nr:Gfo/Idh/MocA family oxidoreductase [Phaeodactylibacter sp.]
MKRRRFLRQTSAAAAGMGLAGMLPVEFLAANRKKISPNEKLGVAVIGCNGMGWTNMTRHFMVDGVECVALCDVDQRVLEKRAAEAQKIQGKAPRLYGDYRKLLEDKDVEAVIIGTPDHWHCLMMVDAVQAGKHVYVEKPIANSIKECRIMMAAGKKYGKVVQVGQWQRSGSHYEDAIAYVRSGKLGKIRLVKAWAYQGWMNPVP